MSTLACPAWNGFIYVTWKLFCFVLNAQSHLLQVSCFVLCLNITHSNEETEICIHTEGGWVAQFSTQCSFSMQHRLEFRRCMRNHPWFLVHFGISYRRTLVLCLINILHVGNMVFLWVRGLSHCHLLHLLAVKNGGRFGMLLLLLRNCSMLAKHAPSFPAYLPQVKDHCSKLCLLAWWKWRQFFTKVIPSISKI